MNEVIETENIKIEDMIYEVRDKQVMLDADLARFYQCANGTKDINKAVKRNLDRFPEDFYFQLTTDECNYISRFQNGTLNKVGDKRGNNIKYLPHAFTEQGVAMLSSVLKTPIASQVSIEIMRAFVLMRKYISTNLLEQKYINNQVMKNKEDIKLLQDSFSKFESNKKVNEIYFDGQIYDAYSKILDIFNEAKEELIIVDGYADKHTLDLIKDLNVQVILVTKIKTLLTETDIDKYNNQYNNLKIIYDDTFHDRYFIIDKEEIYHCGTSLNRVGHKTFSINILEDEIVKTSLLGRINKIL